VGYTLRIFTGPVVVGGGSVVGWGQGHRGSVTRAGCLWGHLSPLAQPVRRPEGRGCQTPQGLRTRERHPQTVTCKCGVGEGRAAGDRAGKLL